MAWTSLSTTPESPSRNRCTSIPRTNGTTCSTPTCAALSWR
jgi:hypothetical protein